MNITEITKEIKRQCGQVSRLNNGWYIFIYEDLHYLYIPDKTNRMIRISVPHVANCHDYSKEIIDAAVNETNREVKYIKTMVLNNGSLSLNYDHKICNESEIIGAIVPHMIRTLLATNEYLTRKLETKKKALPHR